MNKTFNSCSQISFFLSFVFLFVYSAININGEFRYDLANAEWMNDATKQLTSEPMNE